MSERMFNYDEVYSIRNAVGKAFAALRKKGFIARVNFSCYTGYVRYELSGMARTRSKDRAVFWHGQSNEDFGEPISNWKPYSFAGKKSNAMSGFFYNNDCPASENRT